MGADYKRHVEFDRPPPKAIEEESLGLCLSGGGYRAAAFHLGTLAYLDQIGWLSRVRAISTVSGGTILGAAWALSRRRKQSFDEFRQGFIRDLANNDMISRALDVAARAREEPNASPSLARCYAQALAECYFKPCSYENEQEIWLSALSPRTHDLGGLEEIRFNATGFDRGLGFRFVLTKQPDQPSPDGVNNLDGMARWFPRTGNWYDCMLVDDAARVRLSDVVAASSCFPGAFEPLMFPSEFVWRGDPPEVLGTPAPPPGTPETPGRPGQMKRAGRERPRDIGLMDGGIFDNQGIDAMLQIERDGRVDLVLISDTDRQPREVYGPPSLQRMRLVRLFFPGRDARGPVFQDVKAGLSAAGRRIRRWLAASILGVFLTLLGAALAPPSWRTTAWLVLGLWVGGLSALAAFFSFLLGRATGRAEALFSSPVSSAPSEYLPPEIVQRIRKAGAELGLEEVVHLLRNRMASVQAMVFEVFMARIRSLGYQRAYPGREEALALLKRWPHQRISSLIYGLPTHPLPELLTSPPSGLEPISKKVDPGLRALARRAMEFETTLWFSEQHRERLDDLYYAGRAACCLNILKNLARRAKAGADMTEVQEQWALAKWHWEELNRQPTATLTRPPDEGVAPAAQNQKPDPGSTLTSQP